MVDIVLASRVPSRLWLASKKPFEAYFVCEKHYREIEKARQEKARPKRRAVAPSTGSGQVVR